jgi:hypothetical protein
MQLDASVKVKKTLHNFVIIEADTFYPTSLSSETCQSIMV